MSDLYVEIKEIATDVVDWLGKPVTLVKKVIDPVWRKSQRNTRTGIETFWVNSETNEEVTEDPSKNIKYKGMAVEGTYKGSFMPHLAINVGDIRLFIVDTPRPAVGDFLFVGGVKRTVVTCSPVSPGEIDIIYDVQVR